MKDIRNGEIKVNKTEDQIVDGDDIKDIEIVHNISGLNNNNSDQNKKTEPIADSNNIIRSCLNAAFSNIDLIRSFCLDFFPDVHREIKNDASHLSIVDKIIQHCRSNLCEEKLWNGIKSKNLNQYNNHYAIWKQANEMPHDDLEVFYQQPEYFKRGKQITANGIDTEHPLKSNEESRISSWFFNNLSDSEKSMLLTAALFEGMDRKYMLSISEKIQRVLFGFDEASPNGA